MTDSVALRLAGRAYVGGWAAVQHVPEAVAVHAFRAAGDAAFRRGGPRVRQLRTNLARVRPELADDALDDLTHAAVRSYARYWCEVFRLPRWSPDEVAQRLVVHDGHLLEDAVARGDGVVAVLGHLGNWDHLAAWATVRGMPVVTVAERVRPEPLFDRFVSYRQSLGMEVLPLTGDSRLTSTLQQRLRSGHLVALLADRDLARSAVKVHMFGATARMPPGPSVLALRTGAVLMSAFSWYDPVRTHLRLRPQLLAPDGMRLRDAAAWLTQRFADELTDAIRAHPVDWHMLQPFFTDSAHEAAG